MSAQMKAMNGVFTFVVRDEEEEEEEEEECRS